MRLDPFVINKRIGVFNSNRSQEKKSAKIRTVAWFLKLHIIVVLAQNDSLSIKSKVPTHPWLMDHLISMPAFSVYGFHPI